MRSDRLAAVDLVVPGAALVSGVVAAVAVDLVGAVDADDGGDFAVAGVRRGRGGGRDGEGEADRGQQARAGEGGDEVPPVPRTP